MLLTKPYDAARAVEYARRWALFRNPLFVDFTGRGGNCTNFVSQCVLAGSCVMNRTPDYGWYYESDTDRAPAWSGVEYFYSFMTGVPEFASRNGGIGPYAVEVPRRMAQVGDAVQYANEEGDWYHTVIISKVENGEIYVCAQSDNALDRPLSSYSFASARFLHFRGVRFEVDDDACFDYLISGGADVPAPEVPDLPDLPEMPGEQVSQEDPEAPENQEAAPEPQPPAPPEEPEPLPEFDRPETVEGS